MNVCARALACLALIDHVYLILSVTTGFRSTYISDYIRNFLNATLLLKMMKLLLVIGGSGRLEISACRHSELSSSGMLVTLLEVLRERHATRNLGLLVCVQVYSQ